MEVYRNLHDDLKEINSNMEILLTIQNSNALIIDYLRGKGSNIDRSRNALNIIGNGVFLLRKKWGTMNFSMKGLI